MVNDLEFVNGFIKNMLQQCSDTMHSYFFYFTESYDKVRSKLKQAETESDLGTANSESEDSDNEQARKSKRKRRWNIIIVLSYLQIYLVMEENLDIFATLVFNNYKLFSCKIANMII